MLKPLIPTASYLPAYVTYAHYFIFLLDYLTIIKNTWFIPHFFHYDIFKSSKKSKIFEVLVVFNESATAPKSAFSSEQITWIIYKYLQKLPKKKACFEGFLQEWLAVKWFKVARMLPYWMWFTLRLYNKKRQNLLKLPGAKESILLLSIDE